MSLKFLPLFLLSTLSFGQTSGSPLHLEKEVALPGVEGRIDHLSVDISRGRLFVSALGNNTVEIIGIKQGQRIGEIKGLKAPQGVLYEPTTNRIFVANDGDGTVESFDGDSLAHLKTADLHDDADNLRYDATKKLVWVGYGSGGLASFDADLNPQADIKLPVHPESFQLEPDGSKVFVNLPGRLKVSVIDRTTKSVAISWQLSGAMSNYPMAFDAADKRLFVGCRLPARMLIMNADTGEVVGKMPIVGDTDDLFIDPARHFVYVIGGDGAVDVFRQSGPDKYEQISKITTASGARTGLFVPALNELFVAAPHRGTQSARVLVYRLDEIAR
jgi:DNA-binding beta-propeller fold protein YncE